MRLLATTLTGLGLIATAGLANAADLPRKAPAVAPAVVAPYADWTGFYIGAHVGALWKDSDAFWNGGALVGGPYANHHSNFDDASLLAGVHVGYNWQLGQSWVVGIEGDWTWTDTSDRHSGTWFTAAGAAIAGTNHTIGHDLNWLASIRGRVGFLVLPNLLLYATGGGAWGDVDYHGVSTNPGIAYNAAFNSSDTLSGFVAGAGLEWAFSPNWMFRGEYLYYSLDNSVSHIVQPVGFAATTYNWNDLDIHTFRVGVSYKFGGYAPPPVRARY